MFSKQAHTGMKGKTGTHYGAHQHFIVSTRKDRLAAFGITCMPCELDITQFMTPEQLVLLENKGKERSLTRFCDHDAMQMMTVEGTKELMKIGHKESSIKKV